VPRQVHVLAAGFFKGGRQRGQQAARSPGGLCHHRIAPPSAPRPRRTTPALYRGRRQPVQAIEQALCHSPPRRAERPWPRVASQTRRTPSTPSAASFLPSSLHDTARAATASSTTKVTSPVRVSQTLTVRSSLAEARRVPSGCQATPWTVKVWPCRAIVS